MMPRKNGFDVLRELRASSTMPVLMLTARGEDVDSIIGLELGADDYLAKPSNPRVLVARIRAVLRRAEVRAAGRGDAGGPEILKYEDLQVHTGTRTVQCGNRTLDMHISNLRKKLGPLPSGQERILTVRGVGYQYIIE